MKVLLNRQQLNFLQDRFDISEDDINKMNIEEWNSIREKYFYIETDEMLNFFCKFTFY